MRKPGNFSVRGAAYSIGRPHYPKDAVSWAIDKGRLARRASVVDLGAGTGLLTTAIAQHLGVVYAVEPDPGMRAELLRQTRKQRNVRIVAGTAENTRLAFKSIDAIFAGQALHWFNVSLAAAEWKRILKKKGLIFAIWNDRRVDLPAGRALDDLMNRYAISDPTKIGHRAPDREYLLAEYCRAGINCVAEKTFANQEMLDSSRLTPFLESVSFLPLPTDPAFSHMLSSAKEILRKAGSPLHIWRTVVQVLCVSQEKCPMGRKKQKDGKKGAGD